MSHAAPRLKGMSEADVQARCNPCAPPYFAVGFGEALRRCLSTIPRSVFDRHNVRLQECGLERSASDPTRAM